MLKKKNNIPDLTNSIFDVNKGLGVKGFRLDQLELFNWGTFSGRESIEPGLKTSLLPLLWS